MLNRATQAVKDEIQRMRDEFDANRHELCNQWLEFEVAMTAPGKINNTLVPPDFEERIAKAVIAEVQDLNK